MPKKSTQLGKPKEKQRTQSERAVKKAPSLLSDEEIRLFNHVFREHDPGLFVVKGDQSDLQFSEEELAIAEQYAYPKPTEAQQDVYNKVSGHAKELMKKSYPLGLVAPEKVFYVVELGSRRSLFGIGWQVGDTKRVEYDLNEEKRFGLDIDTPIRIRPDCGIRVFSLPLEQRLSKMVAWAICASRSPLFKGNPSVPLHAISKRLHDINKKALSLTAAIDQVLEMTAKLPPMESEDSTYARVASELFGGGFDCSLELPELSRELADAIFPDHPPAYLGVSCAKSFYREFMTTDSLYKAAAAETLKTIFERMARIERDLNTAITRPRGGRPLDRATRTLAYLLAKVFDWNSGWWLPQYRARDKRARSVEPRGVERGLSKVRREFVAYGLSLERISVDAKPNGHLQRLLPPMPDHFR